MCLDDTTVRIPLRAKDGSVRAYALVDAADADFVNQWRWYLCQFGYAYRLPKVNGRKRTVFMHRELLGMTPGNGLEVDHISQDKLDNRRSNLRAISKAGNRQNVSSKRGSSSSFRGVTWNKDSRKWQAQIRVNGKQMYLGLYADEAEAGAVARAARLRLLPYAVD